MQSVFFVALRWAPRPFGGARAKKTPPRVFFFAPAPAKGKGRRSPVGRRHGASPSPAFPRGRSKKTPWVVFFFFCCGPARTLTHSLRAWVAMPPPRRGGVFFFFCGPARTGVVFFFFCCGPARTLTHSLWAGAISARPGWCFFFAAARRVFLDNNKKCLGYYIGSKRPARPQQKKKNTTSISSGFWSPYTTILITRNSQNSIGSSLGPYIKEPYYNYGSLIDPLRKPLKELIGPS